MLENEKNHFPFEKVKIVWPINIGSTFELSTVGLF